MIQEGPIQHVCVAVVVGTPDQAAAFVRQFAPGMAIVVADSVASSPRREAKSADETETTLESTLLDATAVDLAIVSLRRSAGLTTGECLVLALRGRGFTNVSIAEVLDVAPGTVKCHVNHAMRKLEERKGVRPARVLARAIDAVRNLAIVPDPRDAGWLRPLRIAMARLEPRA